MSSTLILFTTILMTIVFLEFNVGKSEIQNSGNTLSMKPDGFVKEELADLFGILAIVIFGIWGILISLGIYNF